MKLHLSENANELIKSKSAVLIDNDVLGLLFSNGDLLQETLSLTSGKKLELYPLVEFEFLRDVFAPQQRILKEEFISQPIFGHIKTETHMKILSKLIENSLLLSKIYAHQAEKKHAKNTSS